MTLRQLKKTLKQQEQRARPNNSRRRFWWFLLLPVLLLVLVPLYNRYQLTAPQRLFEEASKLESLGRLNAAQQLYQRLYQDYPLSDLAAQAMLLNGRIWQYDRHQDQLALLSYLQLEHDYPGHPLVPAARVSAAHIIKYSLQDCSRAIGSFQRLLEQGDGNQDQYLYEIADCYFRLDNYTQARIELETLLEQHPQSPLLAEVLYRKGGLLLLENRYAAARQDWQRLIDEFPNSNYSIQASFNLAKMLEEDNQLEAALERYQQLHDFPRPGILKEKIEHLKQRLAAKKKAI